MPWIYNTSAYNVKKGGHPDPKRCILIQIATEGDNFVEPKYKFDEIYQFYINDDSYSFKSETAKEIVHILNKAMDNNQNVIVHCAAGISRSGAVAEIGVMLGFHDMYSLRIPNIHMKNLMKGYIQ